MDTFSLCRVAFVNIVTELLYSKVKLCDRTSDGTENLAQSALDQDSECYVTNTREYASAFDIGSVYGRLANLIHPLLLVLVMQWLRELRHSSSLMSDNNLTYVAVHGGAGNHSRSSDKEVKQALRRYATLDFNFPLSTS